MGGSGGGGSTSTTTQAGVSKDVKPYQQQQLGIDQSLYTGQNYPQQNTAPFSPAQNTAFQDIQNLLNPEQQYGLNAQNANNQLATGQNPNINATTGSLTGIATGQNPALNTAEGVLGQTATGQNPLLQQAAGASGSLLNDPSIAAAQAANTNIAQGGNLNAANNTALQSYLQAGYLPMEQAYENTVLPGIKSNDVLTGNIGGSGSQNAQNLANSQFAQELGNYTANVVEPAYEQGLTQQTQAIANAPGLLAPKEQGIAGLQSTAGQETGAASALPGAVNTQIGAASAVPGQFNPQLTALGDTTGLVSGSYTPAQQELGAGTQQQQQAQNVLNTIFGNQMIPYQMAQQGASQIPALQGTGGQSFSVNSQPGQGTIK